MSTSDTPRTDALDRHEYTFNDMADHARTLERELAAESQRVLNCNELIDEMHDRLAAARVDSERLDWLDAHETFIDGGDSGWGWYSWEVTNRPKASRKYFTAPNDTTLRAAIDAARKEAAP